MGRIGSLPSVPDEFVQDVAATSWALTNTQRDHTLVLRAVPHQLVTECPSCHDRLVIDVVGSAQQRATSALDSTVSLVMRYATPVAGSTPLAAAAELLADPSRRVLAVVDGEQRPIGVLTAANVLRAVQGERRERLATLTAAEASSWGGPHVPESARLDAVARELVRNDREFVLVVDVGGKLLGLVLASDVLTAL